MQYWMSAVDYPINIGGKPPHSWPAFIVITFEMTILFAGISAVFGMLALNGLPMPYHPVFNVPRFALASKDRFFLIVFSSDPKYDPAGTRSFLERLGSALHLGGAQLACCASAKFLSLPASWLARISARCSPACRLDMHVQPRSIRWPRAIFSRPAWRPSAGGRHGGARPVA